MSDDARKVFLEATFKGPRFKRPELPVDVLPELLAYKEIILRVAKELFRSRYKRTRVPKGFDASFQLVLQGVREGSAIAALRLADETLFPEVVKGLPDGQNLLEEARDRVGDFIAAMQSDQEAPAIDLPPNVIYLFKDFGKHLRSDEEIVVPSHHLNGAARYTPEVRKRIILQVSSTYDKEVELVGPVVALDSNREIVQVRTKDHGLVDVKFSPVQEGVLALAQRDRHFTNVTMRALASFDREERIITPVGLPMDVSFAGDVDEQLIARVDGRLDELVRMEPGWCDGHGEPPSQEAREWVRGVLLGLMAHDELPTPYLYATEAGHIRAEWTFGAWELAAEFKASGPSVTLEAVNTQTREYREDFVLLGAIDEDVRISQFVKGYQPEGAGE